MKTLFDILYELIEIGSTSFHEINIQKYIVNFLNSLNKEFTIDEVGNIYCFNSGYPFLSAHMDAVPLNNHKSSLYTFNDENLNYCIGGLEGNIGADDKCGIAIILFLLQENKFINFIFTVGEESDICYGSTFFIKKNGNLLKKLPFGLVLDRKGKSDIICHENNYGTLSFQSYLHEISIENNFGYSPTKGVFSDANNFKNYISCANLSVGYYNPHTYFEYVVLDYLSNSCSFVNAIINDWEKTDYVFKSDNEECLPKETLRYKFNIWRYKRNTKKLFRSFSDDV